MGIIQASAVCHPPLILPFVGRGEEKGIERTIASYQEVARRVVAARPETIIVTSPHATAYADYFHISPGRKAHGSMRQFRAPDHTLDVAFDTDLVSAIADACADAGIAAGTDGERDRELDHATFIPLWFIAQELGADDGHLEDSFQVVRIGLSGFDALTHYRFGQCIAKAVQQLDRRVVFIASGDLSHKLKEDGPYGFAEEGPVFDSDICEVFRTADFERMLELDPTTCEKAAECGLRSFEIMAGALDRRFVSGGLLSYEGPFGVGYGMATWDVGDIDESRAFGDAYLARQREQAAKRAGGEDIYVRLARASLTSFIEEGHRLSQDEAEDLLGPLPDGLVDRRAGAFVSLHEHGELRGCIGTISATCDTLAEEIIRNAVSACSEDPRFPPVRSDEIDQLQMSVDVLSDAEDIDSPDELDPKRYGVIVSSGFRRGLLLPNLDGVDTVAEQISIASRKGGIREGEKVRLQRFEVVRHT